MSGRARRYKDGRNRGRDRGNSMREGVWRPGRAAHARNLARYAGPLRAVARGVFSAQREKDFFCRQGTGAVLGFCTTRGERSWPWISYAVFCLKKKKKTQSQSV